ncbi:hypothetical protein [Romboutsia sp.]|uniref:hypothetical protein n=1 Tax=Romboutsia sp. TaxID=1965302 RepID=UPI003F3BDB09
MKLTDKVINIIIAETKQRLGWNDANIGKCLEKGCKSLSIKEEKEQIKEKQYAKKFPEDIKRKMRTLKNISLNNIVEKESYKQEFIKFCDLLLAGLETEHNYKEKIQLLIRQIDNYKDQVVKYKIKLEMEKIRMNKEQTKVLFLSDEIYNMIDERSYTSDYDIDCIEDEDKYDKYIAVSRDVTFRIKYETDEAIFRVLRDDLSVKTYLMMIGTELASQVIEFESVKSAVQFILNYISSNEDVELTNMEKNDEIEHICFDGTIEKEIITYDTLNSFGEKIDYLLS